MYPSGPQADSNANDAELMLQVANHDQSALMTLYQRFGGQVYSLVYRVLNDAQLACVRRLIEHHKPAHTDFALCTADSGIRAGLGAHVGISSVLGRSAGFDPAILGEAALGTGFLLGRPALGDETP